MTNAIFSMAI
jgi:hypothetical protein